ncbi:hypothetical protein QEN19_002995 [Hanseniaspora menglaensis]
MPLISSKKELNHIHFQDLSDSCSANNSLDEISVGARKSSGSPYLVYKKSNPKLNQKRITDYYAKKLLKLHFWNNKHTKLNTIKSGVHIDNGFDDFSSKQKNKNKFFIPTSDFDDGDVEDNDNEEEDICAQSNSQNIFSAYKECTDSQRSAVISAGSSTSQVKSPILGAQKDSQLETEAFSSKWKLNKKFKDIFNKKINMSENTANDENNVNSFADRASQKDIQDDFEAREKVLQYVNETIDELWARYCDCSTLVEEEIYPTESNVCSNSRLSTYDIKRKRRRSTLTSMDADNKEMGFAQSELEGSAYKLNRYRETMSKCKKEMEFLVDSYEIVDIVKFWNLWDGIKWVCFKIMELEEEDFSESDLSSNNETSATEKYEETLQDLERKRFF